MSKKTLYTKGERQRNFDTILDRIELSKPEVNNKVRSICMLVTDFDAPTGGVQKNSRLLLREFNIRGIKTYVCVRNYHGLARNETLEGTEVHRTKVVGNSMAVNGILYMLGTFWWLALNRKKFDIIHCQQIFGPTMVAVVAGWLIKKPILTRITLSGPTGEAAAIRELPLAGLRLKLIRRVNSWIALTGEMKREIESLGIESAKIAVIHNATRIPEECSFRPKTRLKYREKLGLNASHVGVFTGRLSREKCLDILIRSWEVINVSFPDSKLIILGEGGEYRNTEAELRRLVEELGLAEHVLFLGHVNNAKEYVMASDAFVLPSNAEGMSNSLVEAFACGASIIASDIGANREICVDGENSLIVPVGDVDSLAAAISRLFKQPEFAAELGRSARGYADSDLSINKMVSSYVAIYDDVIHRYSRRGIVE